MDAGGPPPEPGRSLQADEDDKGRTLGLKRPVSRSVRGFEESIWCLRRDAWAQRRQDGPTGQRIADACLYSACEIRRNLQTRNRALLFLFETQLTSAICYLLIMLIISGIIILPVQPRAREGTCALRSMAGQAHSDTKTNFTTVVASDKNMVANMRFNFRRLLHSITFNALYVANQLM